MQYIVGPHSLVVADVVMLDRSHTLGRGLASLVDHNIFGALSRFQRLGREAAFFIQ